MVTDHQLILISLIIFGASVFRTAFGFGEALVAVPLLSLFLPIRVAAPLAVMASVLIALVAVWRDWRHIHRGEAKNLLLATLLGLPLGLVLLRFVPEGVTKALLGLLLLGFSSFSLVRPQSFRLGNDRWVWLFGFVAGVTGGSYGMNGPPLAIYGAARRWPPEKFRATMQAYFLPASFLGLVGYAVAGIWTARVSWLFVDTLPAILIGILLGRLLNRKMPAALFARLLHIGLILIAILLLRQAVI